MMSDDEFWGSSIYSGKASQPNCVVGEALMFHFSYFTTVKQMLELGFLKEFETIVLMELFGALPRTLWNATEFFRYHHRTRPPMRTKLVLFETKLCC